MLGYLAAVVIGGIGIGLILLDVAGY